MKREDCTYEVANTVEPEKGWGPIRRRRFENAKTGMKTQGGRVTLTHYENFQESVRLFGARPYLGWRPIKNGEAQDFIFQTYAQISNRVNNIGSAIAELDLAPDVPDEMLRNKGSLGMYCPNRIEWVLIELACGTQSKVCCPMYDTLPVDGIVYVIDQAQLKTMFTSAALVPNVIEAKKRCPSLQYIIQAESEINPEHTAAAEAAGLRIVSIEQLEKIGITKPHKHRPPSPDDACTFCYTSGTTGNPKGAILDHRGLCVQLADFDFITPELNPDDVYLSYLPLPHVFERAMQLICTSFGGRIGFFQGDTLKLVDDLIALRPTIFCSVPRLLNRIHDKLHAGVKAEGGLKETLFNRAVATKLAALEDGHTTHRLWDRLVFSKVKAKVGLDRCKVVVTGAAPISDTVLNFLRVLMSCPVLEGYGQTEATLAISLSGLDETTSGHVGILVPCYDCRLQDVPDMGYFHTDKSHGKGKAQIACEGRGEICVRGLSTMKGYYKMPDKTAEAIDEEGWLHTGDVGLFLPDGRLKIIDRKKNLLKLAQGEYVAVEKIELVILQSEFVIQCFVYGDPLKNEILSIIVLDPDVLALWAQSNGKSQDGITQDKELYKAVDSSLNKLFKKNNFLGFECPKKFHLEIEQWTPADVLTPTFKLKRKDCQEKYQAEIDAMYAELEKQPQKAKL